jgi:carboxyl-terminal processing protease
VHTLEKTLKHLAIILLFIAGAVFLYMAGLGTGLYVAQPLRSASASELSLSATPSPAGPSPTETSPPLLTQAPTPSTPSASGPSTDEEQVDLDIFWEAWDILEEDFYGELPAESELPYAAIEGVIATTGDPYTAFLDPVRAEIVKADLTGSFEGIGATVRIRPDGKLEVVQPLPDHPAIKAGLRAGDVVLKVDGVAVQGMNIYEAISLIRGPAGTTVHLLVEREEADQTFEMAIERAQIELPVVRSEMLESDIAYIRLNEFGQTATAKLKEALNELNAQGPQALIFDLRGNPGGYLSTSIEVASQFVGQGPILIERFKGGQEQTYEAIPGGLALDVPLVVLVDGGTASASEIVAGAIQDTERGTLIGTTTLGKGSVQLVHTLSDGSQLRVTNARWFTPSGRAIHGDGLKPDIEVEITEQDITAGSDPQLERAITYLLEGR